MLETKNKFVHLHVHSEFSLLDGLSKIGKLMDYVKENEMESIALTDHGVMYGAVEFYKKALKEGLKPIIGIEAYTTNIDRKLRPERTKAQNNHLILLAADNEGYQNLMKLTSIAHIEGYYYRPRVDKDTLKKYSRGLICTSACPQGEIAQALISGNYQEAKSVAEWFLDVFDRNYYLEIQRHEYATFVQDIQDQAIKTNVLTMQIYEKTIIEGVIKLSRELGIPIVATNDMHYIKKDDAQAQDALVCIATGKKVSDTKRLRFIDVPTFYLKTQQEMASLFSDLPEAIENTVKISQKCEISLTLDKWFFPEYKLEKGLTVDSEMEKRVWSGIKKRVPIVTKEMKERIIYEMSIIKKKGYSTYFLIVSDMAQWAIEHEIITNTRGSAAGSLVSYSLGIININPLDYDLPFERFLTPWRPSPPDIDFDIADDKREEVINYIEEKYGRERVAQICTFGRMMAKAAVRDISRVLGFPYSTGDRIAKLIPFGSQGFPMSIEKALKVSSDLKDLYDNDLDTKRIVDLARKVEGNARHISVHAAGIVIAPSDITNFTPIQKDPDGKRIITQYDMDSLDPNISPNEAVGLLKFDLLGLRNLSILGSAIQVVNKVRAEKLNLMEISLNDKKTYEMLAKGDTMGVFQLSGSGMTRYLKDLKPTRIEDLMAMVALFRPGPMSKIPEYIDRKNNPSKISYFDPRMKEFLGKSYGLLVYQDDVFMTAIKIAGYTWEEADKFRKAVGKKIPAEMEKQKEKFIQGAMDGGLTRQKAEELFLLIEPFSGYGFNKAHAASYGMLAYQTAFMKANYPVEFMAALLTAESKDAEKISSAVNECRRMGISILPPDINDSEVGFKIVDEKDTGKAIRFGLDAIKNVGKAAIENILEARQFGKFVSFADFCSKVDTRKVNKKVLESLIKVGALSIFGNRAALLSSIDQVRNIIKPKITKGQQDLFSEEDKRILPDINKVISNVTEFSQEELQQLERQLLGFSISARPLSEIIGALSLYATHKIYEISPQLTYGEMVRIAGVIIEVRIVTTRRTGSEMAFVKIEDETATLGTIVFPKIFKLTENIWVENKGVLLSGRIDARDDTPTLIVETVETEEFFKPKRYSLQIKIPQSASKNSLIELKKLLLMHPGGEKVTLIFEGNNRKSIELLFGVSWNETLSRLISEILRPS